MRIERTLDALCTDGSIDMKTVNDIKEQVLGVQKKSREKELHEALQVLAVAAVPFHEDPLELYGHGHPVPPYIAGNAVYKLLLNATNAEKGCQRVRRFRQTPQQ